MNEEVIQALKDALVYQKKQSKSIWDTFPVCKWMGHCIVVEMSL